MTGDVFKLEIRLDRQSMTEFGGCVSYIGCNFPAGVLTDVQELERLCFAADLDLPGIRTITARLLENAKLAVRIGDGVATVIGMCEPVRIDGGPFQGPAPANHPAPSLLRPPKWSPP